MNKKEYIKPETEIVTLEFDAAILSASNFAPETGDEYEGDEAGANQRRGKWGDLWYKEEV